MANKPEHMEADLKILLKGETLMLVEDFILKYGATPLIEHLLERVTKLDADVKELQQKCLTAEELQGR